MFCCGEIRKNINIYYRMYYLDLYRFQNYSKNTVTDVTKTGWGKNELLIEDLVPEPHPPKFRKKDLIPDSRVFKVFDQYAIQVSTQNIDFTDRQLLFLDKFIPPDNFFVVHHQNSSCVYSS